MISYISGSVIYKDEKSAIVETANGLGYKIFVTEETLSSLSENKVARFWTYLAVREDAHILYGFPEKSDLDFFELLLTVSGIGPKTALGILNMASVLSIKTAVSSNDPSHLVKISGIGKKMAEKMVWELKDKVKSGENSSATLKDEIEALEALKSIGYGHKEARDALKEIKSGTARERIKSALKTLGK
ncbi:MAG: Holliday junction branch migration protein RuvA [bacterium]|nr:Holliday junction branch migration protein RuvA [bacterium]